MKGKPKVGDLALHVDGLDGREVAKVSDDGTLVWLYFLTPDRPYGPFPASNYRFKALPKRGKEVTA